MSPYNQMHLFCLLKKKKAKYEEQKQVTEGYKRTENGES